MKHIIFQFTCLLILFFQSLFVHASVTNIPEMGPMIPEIATINVKPLEPIKEVAAVELEPVQPVATPASAPAQPVTGGCVTGFSTGQYALDQIIAHESGGNSCATNAGGCFGLLQACPGAPLRAACGGDPSCQIAWFVSNKTGGRSWEAIWALWQTQGWW